MCRATRPGGVDAPKPDAKSVKPDAKSVEAEKVARVPYTTLFRFATTSDLFLTALGCLCGMGNGVVFPCFSVIFGKILNAYATPTTDFTSTINEVSLD